MMLMRLRRPTTCRAMQTLSSLHQHHGKRLLQYRSPILAQHPPTLPFKPLFSHLSHVLQQTQHSLLAPKKRDLHPEHAPTQDLQRLPLPNLPIGRSPLPHDLPTPRTRPQLSPLQALQPIKRQPLLHQTHLPHAFRQPPFRGRDGTRTHIPRTPIRGPF